jgi:hypothetical protein
MAPETLIPLGGVTIMNLPLRRRALRIMLLGCLLALGACDLGPPRFDAITARTYECNGADPNAGYSACDREPPSR